LVQYYARVSFGAFEAFLLPVMAAVSLVAALAWVAHYASYQWIKRRVLQERRWDYNICCGTTDGGGINADIVRHADIPRFELVRDVTKLPHPDAAFEHVLCSHTIEHVDDPGAMYRELRRISRNLTILIPPLWDFTAALNPFEHQVIFLTLRSRHDNRLPHYVRFGLARWIQSIAGQKINADVLAQGGPGTLQQLFHYAVPALFIAAAGLGFAGHRLAWALFALGFIALWASRRAPARDATARD